MLHFPSKLQGASRDGLPRRSDSLNATQQKSHAHPIFLTIEEELHDARRVHSHGQEEDLRLALNMVINRVGEMSSLLKEAYKAQAELETQLNLTKSNLQLVISNNEMLEEALKRDGYGHSKDVGWRRWSAREGESRTNRVSLESGPGTPSITIEHGHSPTDSGSSAASTSSPTLSAGAGSYTPVTGQDSSFFQRFKFSSGSSTPSQSPNLSLNPNSHLPHSHPHLTSPSLPSLPSQVNKELETLTAQLETERKARQAVAQEKAALEAEIEALSQALFEEANKMVATERIKRAETEEELKEARLEKEALRSALRLVEGENSHLRNSSTSELVQSGPPSPALSRSSSRVGIKSLPTSPTLSYSQSRPDSMSSAYLSMLKLKPDAGLDPDPEPSKTPEPPSSSQSTSVPTAISVGSQEDNEIEDADAEPTPQSTTTFRPSLDSQSYSQYESEPSPWAQSALPLSPAQPPSSTFATALYSRQ